MNDLSFATLLLKDECLAATDFGAIRQSDRGPIGHPAEGVIGVRHQIPAPDLDAGTHRLSLGDEGAQDDLVADPPFNGVRADGQRPLSPRETPGGRRVVSRREIGIVLSDKILQLRRRARM